MQDLMTTSLSNSVGPVTDTALGSAKAALAALQDSQCYKQYKANGTLAKTKLGECERDLLLVIKDLGG
jgi:hypothetical protein